MGFSALHSDEDFDIFLQNLYQKLIYWTNHNNPEMAHAGMMAMEAFLKQVRGHVTTHQTKGTVKMDLDAHSHWHISTHD